MFRLIVVTGTLMFWGLFLTSCDQQQAVDKLMQNEQIVENIMNKMWEDPALKQKLVEKVFADQVSYDALIDSTLADSTRFTDLIKKVEANQDLKKQIISLGEAWKKEARRKR